MTTATYTAHLPHLAAEPGAFHPRSASAPSPRLPWATAAPSHKSPPPIRTNWFTTGHGMASEKPRGGQPKGAPTKTMGA